MRKALITLFVLFNLNSFAQTNDTFDFKVIDTVNATKIELYTRAREFVALNFKNSKSVIQMDDKEAGEILCKGVIEVYTKFQLGMLHGSYIDFTMKIDVKDNKYRCILSDFYHDGFDSPESGNSKCGYLNNDKPNMGNGFNGMPEKYWIRIKDETKYQALLFIESFKTAMEKSSMENNF